MSTRRTIQLFIAISISVLFSSCSNQKAEYEEVQTILNATDQTIQQTSDYDIKIKTCDDAINALNKFVTMHKEGEWVNIAKNSLAAWESKKSSFQQELESLYGNLSMKLRQKAIDGSKNIHPLSNIEIINRDNMSTIKDGYNIRVTENYSVRMRGSMLGASIFKLNVRTSGRIAMDTKVVLADDGVTVQE